MNNSRKQSIRTALRHVRRVIRRAKQTDFTSNPEDAGLSTMYRAASTMYAFWQEMSREESMCDCADRSWYGDGHDSQCNVTLINNMLDEIGTVEPERQPAAEQWGKPQQAKSYFVLFVESDVEPHLHGPFPTAEERDQVAKNLRAQDRSDPKSGIYRLDCTAPEIDSYSGAFFEEGENADTTEICTPGARS